MTLSHVIMIFYTVESPYKGHIIWEHDNIIAYLIIFNLIIVFFFVEKMLFSRRLSLHHTMGKQFLGVSTMFPVVGVSVAVTNCPMRDWRFHCRGCTQNCYHYCDMISHYVPVSTHRACMHLFNYGTCNCYYIYII